MIQTEYPLKKGPEVHSARRRASLSNTDRIDHVCQYAGYRAKNHRE